MGGGDDVARRPATLRWAAAILIGVAALVTGMGAAAVAGFGAAACAPSACTAAQASVLIASLVIVAIGLAATGCGLLRTWAWARIATFAIAALSVAGWVSGGLDASRLLGCALLVTPAILVALPVSSRVFAGGRGGQRGASTRGATPS